LIVIENENEKESAPSEKGTWEDLEMEDIPDAMPRHTGDAAHQSSDAAHVHLVQVRHMSQNRSTDDAIRINHTILGRKQAQIFTLFLSSTTPNPLLHQRSSRCFMPNRVAMASKHTPDDQKVIDSLSMGVMSRDGISKPGTCSLPTR
jgi:hypothetical protein